MTPDDSLIDWLKIAWKEKFLVGLAGACGILIGVLTILVLRPQYEARMIVAPALHDYQDKILTNENFPTPMVERSAETLPREFTRFEQTFREVTTARALLKHLKFLESVNRDGLFRFKREEIGDAGSLSNYLKREVKIRPLGATSSRLIAYRHPDPLFAVLMLASLHGETDNAIREDSRRRANNRIDYLQKELQSAFNPEHRQALTGLLMAEERDLMLSSMDAPYAADILEPPAASLKPIWPCPAVILSAGAFLGIIFGFALAALRPRT